MYIYIILLILAYLIGSIPTSVWVGKIFYKIDVREHGSGNAGATNTFRVLGVKAGIPVFLFDTFKGWLAVKLILLVHFIPASNYVTYEIFLGISSILGHIYPVFAQFRGGKGVSTTLGIIIAINPLSALILLIIFAISLIITRYVSLSSIICALSYPILIIYYSNVSSDSLIIFSIIIAIVVILTHQKNIKRLFSNEEKKVNFLKINRKNK